MRRKGHPSRPRAITCCRFSSLKTLLMPTKATVPTSESTSQAPFSLAGFQVTIIGRFWGSSALLVKGAGERIWAAPGKLVRKHDESWVSWVAEVVLRLAHEPVAVALPR